MKRETSGTEAKIRKLELEAEVVLWQVDSIERSWYRWKRWKERWKNLIIQHNQILMKELKSGRDDAHN